MRKPSVTYRFICILTALTVLLGMGIPSGLSAAGLSAHCPAQAMEHGDSHSAGAPEHCDLAEKDHHAPANEMHTEDASCELDFSCSCSTDAIPFEPSAAPASSKISLTFAPVIVQVLDFTPASGPVNVSEQVFATLYSPPLYLKNSSFLN